MKRQLILEDGSVFVGHGFGSQSEVSGEIVFNTAMTGYQEIISDPSYYKQILMLTYPIIGNYGINRDDFESRAPAISGLIVREACEIPSNFRSTGTLSQLLHQYKIPGIQGVDTRRLTRIIRDKGTLRGQICPGDADVASVVKQLKTIPLPQDQVSHVSTKQPYICPGRGYRVVVVDLGCRSSIIRHLIELQCEVIVVPYNSTATEILQFQPDGVLLSNGPGSPLYVPEVIPTIQELLGIAPIFGIGLGHLLLALASGATTRKLPFGHHGTNHPVKDLATGRVTITSQSHDYTVEADSLKNTDLMLTHVNVNHETVIGLKHSTFPAFSLQYIPVDNRTFQPFLNSIADNKKGEILNG